MARSNCRSKSLCVILGARWIIAFDLSVTASYNNYPCSQGIIVSYFPWIIRIGHWIFFIFSIFLNLSDNKKLNFPQTFDATLRIDVKGLINITAPGLRTLAKWHTGPDPMDLPYKIIFSGLILNTPVTKSNTISASFNIFSSLVYPLYIP